MIAIICGGRDYQYTGRDEDLLDALPITRVYHGACGCSAGEVQLTHMRGADRFAELWAMSRGRDRHPMPADFVRNGPSGGPIRNAEMLRTALLDATKRHKLLICIAFPGGKGTADMIRKARSAGVPVLQVW